MSEKRKIILLFPLTPEEQDSLLQKQADEFSVQEQMNIQNESVLQTADELNNVKVYETPEKSDPHSSKKGMKRIAAFVAVICAMLVGGGIAVAMMSAKNEPAAGVNAVSGQVDASLTQFSQSESSLSHTTAERTIPTTHRDSYSYEDGFLTIRSDKYFESDYKEYMSLSDIKKVKIERGVTVIGSKAFDGCSNLSDIEIPDTVVRIGESAFEDCISLTDVSLPKGLQTIEGWAFAGCTSLKAIHIPNNVSWIGNLVFSKCSALEAVYVDENNQFFSSSDGVLFDKDKTILYKYPSAKSDTSYIIPDGVKYIEDHSICVCNNLTSITIPESVLYIGDRSFSHCQNLTSINIPSNVEYIGAWAFSGCLQIRTINIPGEVTYIDHSAFNVWSNEQKIIIKDRQSPPDTWHENWNASCNASIIWE